jgi:hypothetical protein
VVEKLYGNTRKKGPSVKEVRLRARRQRPRADPPRTQLNEMLDKLARGASRGDKVKVLRPMILEMDYLQVKWLCSIILKDMRLGMGEKQVLRDFHEDAEVAFNNCCDLRKTFKLIAPYYKKGRLPRYDCEVRALCLAPSPSFSPPLTRPPSPGA